MMMHAMFGESVGMRVLWTGLVAALCLGALDGGVTAGGAVPAEAQGKDNPEFAYWSNCKVGSWVKLKMDMVEEGKKIEAELTVKLVELTAEKAVIERSGKVKVAGQSVDMPTDKDEVKAKVEEPDKFLKEGDEEIEVAGKKLKCRWAETLKTEGGVKTQSKAWMTKEIPGGVAKAESKPEGAKEMTQKVAAIAWEKK